MTSPTGSVSLELLSPGLGDPHFDIGWWDDDTFVVAEVKSITAANETGQFRLGLGQVLDYAATIQRSGRKVKAVLAVEQQPSAGRWVELCANHGVTLTWPANWPRL